MEKKMPSKLEEIRRRAEEAARDLDQKYKISSKLDQGTRAAGDALRKGADVASSGIDAARDEISRIDREHRISERVTDSARRAAEAAQEQVRKSGAKEKASEVAEDVKSTASDVFGEARRFYENASGAARSSVSAARLPTSVLSALSKGRTWAKQNPGKAAVISLAFVAGTRAGSAFPGLDVTLLGAGGAGNWLFHSAVVPYGLRKLAEKYESYLKSQEELLRDGKLDESEAARVRFQRDAAKYAGAPLLGAFSVAAGAGLIYEAVMGGAVTGFPISLVLGGNPLLTSVWLFGNGLVCFHNGYRFFMMAFGDQEEVARVVRDIKGLLPVGS
jgi:hypothetical protein